MVDDFECGVCWGDDGAACVALEVDGDEVRGCGIGGGRDERSGVGAEGVEGLVFCGDGAGGCGETEDGAGR